VKKGTKGAGSTKDGSTGLPGSGQFDPAEELERKLFQGLATVKWPIAPDKPDDPIAPDNRQDQSTVSRKKRPGRLRLATGTPTK
jgi:hypothetical protein